MKYILLIGILALSNAVGQVCCSPVGSGQAGGGASMNNWVAHWPNTLMGDDNWHWMSDAQITHRGPAGNINYGPAVNILFEVSHSIGRRNVFFANGYGGVGSLEEKVTYLESSTISYSGGFSMGLRIALGDRGRSFGQLLLNLPSKIEYLNQDFPFDSEEGISWSVLLLYTHPVPWAKFNPDFLNALSFSFLYEKNTMKRDNILSDHRSLVHLSSAIHSWHPLFLAPFVQLRAEQLIAPPSIWSGTRETRILGSVEVGIDVAISKPYWEYIKVRVAWPFAAWSSSNGFPDGSQPASYLMLAVNTSGIFGGSDH
ncbi:MAG: hypothetical protein H8E26_09850 [FCB group bacterium]|nr:hypothetical protein [FCB group bacterium]MBL7028137.1 hypothetical protein [Candidatus Neomarinimicrobiota bacterium]MBL7122923.1 hypothetical protein [Candidatus Neomarinimicrobiota bacterium]